MPHYRNRQGLLAASGQTTMRLGGDAGSHGDPGFKPVPRFVTIGDGGIVHDRATGRMWVADQRRIVPGSPTAAQVQAARGHWQTGTAYTLYDLVSQDPVDYAPFYVCIEAHTSGSFTTDLAAGKWVYTYWPTTALSLTGGWREACFWNPGFSSVQAIEDLDYGGYSDWRLPTQALQLCSLIDWERDGYVGQTAWFHADSICAPNDQVLWTDNVLASDTDFVCQYGPENEFATAHHSGAGVAIAVRGA